MNRGNKILVVLTGGTFGSFTDEKGIVRPSEKKKVKNIISSLLNPFGMFFKIIAPFNILSENCTPKHWNQLVFAILNEIQNNKYDGIIITHGTDTMAYTSAALSYIEVISKNIPVVITGANYPIFNDYTDAPVNFQDSVTFLKWAISHYLKGVFIVFNGYDRKSKDQPTKIHLGTKVKKVAWEGYCYKSFYLDKDYLGKIYNDEIVFDFHLYNELFPQKYVLSNLNYGFSSDIFALKVYPGFNPLIIEHAIDLGAKYIILELYNSGTGPADQSEYSLLPVLKKFRNRVLFFAVSQHEGKKGATMDIYETSNLLKETGIIPLKDMTWEAAIPKLMLATFNFTDYKKIKDLMLCNIAGEIS